MGDPAGIGPEITVRALNRKETYEKCRPIVTGDAAIMKQALEQNVNKEMPNITLELAKKALDIAIDDAIAYGTYDDQEYNFTIEFYITDANGNKVYSRSIVVKDGKATKK
jgi:4-hydroxy-L-threonine phosphate dehydrogenase PdxA